MIKYKKVTWLISGYNTAPKKEKYDIERLCRYTGNFIFVLAAGWAVNALLLFAFPGQSDPIIWAGLAVLAAAIIIGIVFLNTGGRLKKAGIDTGRKNKIKIQQRKEIQMKFLWCTLQVEDMEASLAFYTAVVGLEINGKLTPAEDIEIVFLGKGDTQLELICNQNYQRKAPCEGISIGFETPNLDDTMNFVHSKGIKIHSGPFKPSPHSRFFYIQDPDGYMVQFVENS